MRDVVFVLTRLVFQLICLYWRKNLKAANAGLTAGGIVSEANGVYFDRLVLLWIQMKYLELEIL